MSIDVQAGVGVDDSSIYTDSLSKLTWSHSMFMKWTRWTLATAHASNSCLMLDYVHVLNFRIIITVLQWFFQDDCAMNTVLGIIINNIIISSSSIM